MKKFFVLILASLFTCIAFTQQEEAVDSPTAKKLTKEQKKNNGSPRKHPRLNL